MEVRETTNHLEHRHDNVGVPLLVGAAMALLAAGAEFLIGTDPVVRRGIEWDTVLQAYAPTAVFFFAAYEAGWFLAVLHLARRRHFNLQALSFSIGASLLLFFVLLCTGGFHAAAGPPRSEWGGAGIAVAALGSVAGGICLYQLLAGLIGRYRAAFRSSLVICGAVMAIVLLGRGTAPGEASTRTADRNVKRIPRVILIVVDALRKDSLSCYPGSAVKTPSIRRLAEDCVVFSKAYSPSPWTVPAMASMLTGYSPAVHLATERDSKIPDSVPTIAESMREGGYRTAAVVVQEFLGSESGYARGFDEYIQYPRKLRALGARFLKAGWPYGGVSYYPDAEEVTERAMEWLRENRDRDFFLWLHYLDPHVPYSPPADCIPKGNEMISFGENLRSIREARTEPGRFSQDRREKIRGVYYGEVRFVDEAIGRLTEEMKDLGLYNESLIIMTSDHGEEFWDHGGFEHGHTLYNELTCVPLLVKLPFASRTGRIGNPVTTQSIPWTIVGVCGVGRSPGSVFAPSIAPLLEGRIDEYTTPGIVSSSLLYVDEQISVVFGNLKYIRSLETGKRWLYAVATDPGERRSMLESSSGAVLQAEEILARYESTATRTRKLLGVSGPEQATLDRESWEMLESVGYFN